MQDINTDIPYLERKVSRPTVTKDDKGILQELYKNKEKLNKNLEEISNELKAL